MRRHPSNCQLGKGPRQVPYNISSTDKHGHYLWSDDPANTESRETEDLGETIDDDDRILGIIRHCPAQGFKLHRHLELVNKV
jgi:hypothetical protein